MTNAVKQFCKTRLAPTPSGFLHLGNVLSFSLTAYLAHKTNAKILLRIDDLDRDRVQPGYVQDIFDTLDFLEIPYNEGPKDLQDFQNHWSQMHRMELYQKALQKLQEEKAVYACTCSRSQLKSSRGYPGHCQRADIALDQGGACWRFKTDFNTSFSLKTWPDKAASFTLPQEVQDFIVRKKDSYPAYHLASVCDDEYYGVDLIVRGADLWPSTLAQMALAVQLENTTYINSTFYHHVLLLAPGGDKLSKSVGDTSIRHLRSSGSKPADIYTMIAQNLDLPELPKNWQELGELLIADSVLKYGDLQ